MAVAIPVMETVVAPAILEAIPYVEQKIKQAIPMIEKLVAPDKNKSLRDLLMFKETHRPENKVEKVNVEKVEETQKQLEKQEVEIEKVEEEVKKKPDNKGLKSKLDGYIRLYQKNAETFQKQLEMADSLFQQSKNYKFY